MTKITACKGDQAVRLVADFRAWPQTTIKWYKENRELHNGTKYHMAYLDSVAELVIRNIFKNDRGTYTVVATNPFGEALLSAELAVEDAIDGRKNHGETHLLPSILVQPLSDQMIRVGKKARFTVAASYPPEPQVHWYKNKEKFEENDRFQISKQGGVCTLDITMVEPTDDGIWKCEVITSFGYAVSMARLRAVVPKGYRKPEFLEGLKALLTEQGTVSLECKVVGVPTPLLRWFKDGKEIKAGDMFNLQMQNNDESSLGTYTCVALNCMGKAVSSAQVTVMDKLEDKLQTKVKVEEPTPYFLESLEDRTIKVGENCRFTVRVRTPPAVQIAWYNKEEAIEMSEKFHPTQVDDGIFHLDVTPVELFDEGEWRCVAINPFGQTVSTCLLKLTVPKNYRNPEFVEDLQTIFTDDGLVSFECKVVGVPTPVLRWYKDGMELKPGDVHQLSGTNSLGSYSCVAKNCMGLATSSAELTLEDIYGAKERRKPPSRHPPRFTQHLKDEVAVIGDNFRFTVAVTCPPVPEVTWYKDNLRVEESPRYHLRREKNGVYQLDLELLEMSDQGSWKCLAVNDYGHSLTQCCLKVLVPKHYKKPKFIENLRAVLSEEGTVSLECKVVGVPQPVLKWYKDGIELKAGDIYKIVSGEGGTSSLGTYTCEASNCMGTSSSTAALLAFDDKYLRDRLRHDTYQRDLSTIEERDEFSTYGTPSVTDNWDESKAEMEFSIYETPDITEDEARQIIEMFADEVSEHVSLKEAPDLPPLRFIKESAMVGNILMEAVIIDVPQEYCSRAEDLSQQTPLENLATEADFADFSIMDPLVVDLPYDYSEAASLAELKVDFSSEGQVHIREASVKEALVVDSQQPLSVQGPLVEETAMDKVAQVTEAVLVETPEPEVHQTPEPEVHQTPEPEVHEIPEPEVTHPPEQEVSRPSEPEVAPQRRKPEPEVVDANMIEVSEPQPEDVHDQRPTTNEPAEAVSEDITPSDNLGTDADVESIASLEEIATDYVNGFDDLDDEGYLPARTPVVESEVGDVQQQPEMGRSTPTYESAMEYPPGAEPTAATPTPTPDMQQLLEAEAAEAELYGATAGSQSKDPGLLAELAAAVLQKAAEGIVTTAVLAESLVATAANLIVPSDEQAGSSRHALEEQAFALEEVAARQELAEIEQTDFAEQLVAESCAEVQVATSVVEQLCGAAAEIATAAVTSPQAVPLTMTSPEVGAATISEVVPMLSEPATMASPEVVTKEAAPTTVAPPGIESAAEPLPMQEATTELKTPGEQCAELSEKAPPGVDSLQSSDAAIGLQDDRINDVDIKPEAKTPPGGVQLPNLTAMSDSGDIVAALPDFTVQTGQAELVTSEGVAIQPITIEEQMALEDGITDENGNIDLELALASVSLHTDQALQLETVAISEECPRVGDAEPRQGLQVHDGGVTSRQLAVVETVSILEHGTETLASAVLTESLVPVEVPSEEALPESLEVAALSDRPQLRSDDVEGATRDLQSSTSGSGTQPVAEPEVNQAAAISSELAVAEVGSSTLVPPPEVLRTTEAPEVQSGIQQLAGELTSTEQVAAPSTQDLQDSAIVLESPASQCVQELADVASEMRPEVQSMQDTGESKAEGAAELNQLQQAIPLPDSEMTKIDAPVDFAVPENEVSEKTSESTEILQGSPILDQASDMGILAEEHSTVEQQLVSSSGTPALAEQSETAGTLVDSSVPLEILQSSAIEQTEPLKEQKQDSAVEAKVGVASEEYLLTAAEVQFAVPEEPGVQELQLTSGDLGQASETAEPGESATNLVNTTSLPQEGVVFDAVGDVQATELQVATAATASLAADGTGSVPEEAKVQQSSSECRDGQSECATSEILELGSVVPIAEQTSAGTLEQAPLSSEVPSGADQGGTLEVASSELGTSSECAPKTAQVDNSVMAIDDQVATTAEVLQTDQQGPSEVNEGQEQQGHSEELAVAVEVQPSPEQDFSGTASKVLEDEAIQQSTAMDIGLELVPKLEDSQEEAIAKSPVLQSLAEDCVEAALIEAMEEFQSATRTSELEDVLEDQKLQEDSIVDAQQHDWTAAEKTAEKLISSCFAEAIQEGLLELTRTMQSTPRISDEDQVAMSLESSPEVPSRTNAQEILTAAASKVADEVVARCIMDAFESLAEVIALLNKELEEFPEVELQSVPEQEGGSLVEQTLSMECPKNGCSAMKELQATQEVAVECATEGIVDGTSKSEVPDQHLAGQEQVLPVSLEDVQQLTEVDKPDVVVVPSEVVDSNCRAEVVEVPVLEVQDCPVVKDGSSKSEVPDQQHTEQFSAQEQICSTSVETTQQLEELQKPEVAPLSSVVEEVKCQAETTEVSAVDVQQPKPEDVSLSAVPEDRCTKPEVPEVAKPEVPEVAKSDVPEEKKEKSKVSKDKSKKTKVPKDKIAKSEVPEEATPEVPTEPKPEVPTEAKPKVPEVAKPKIPEVAKPEVPEVAKPEVPEVAKPEVPEVAKPEVPEVAKPEVPKVAKPEVPEVAKPEVPEVAKPEVPEVAKPEVPEEKKEKSKVSKDKSKKAKVPKDKTAKSEVPEEAKPEAPTETMPEVPEDKVAKPEVTEEAKSEVPNKHLELQDALTQQILTNETVEQLEESKRPEATAKSLELARTDCMAEVREVAILDNQAALTEASGVSENVPTVPKVEDAKAEAETSAVDCSRSPKTDIAVPEVPIQTDEKPEVKKTTTKKKKKSALKKDSETEVKELKTTQETGTSNIDTTGTVPEDEVIPVEQESQKSAKQELQKSAEQSSQKSAERELQKSAEEELQKSAERELQKSTEQESQKSAEQESQKSAVQELQKSAEQSSQKSAERELQKSAEEELQKSVERELQKSAAQESQKSAEQESQKSAEQEFQSSTVPEDHGPQTATQSDTKQSADGAPAKEGDMDKLTDSDLSQEIPKSEGIKESRLKRKTSRKDKLRGRTSRQDSRDSSTGGEQTDEGEDFSGSGSSSSEPRSRQQKRVSRTTSGGDLARIHEMEESAEKRRSSCPNVDPLPEIKELAEAVSKKAETGSAEVAEQHQALSQEVPQKAINGHCSGGPEEATSGDHSKGTEEVQEKHRKKTKTKKKSSKQSDGSHPAEAEVAMVPNGDNTVEGEKPVEIATGSAPVEGAPTAVSNGAPATRLPGETEEKDGEKDEGIEKETREPEVGQSAVKEVGTDTANDDSCKSGRTELLKSDEKSSGYSTEDGKSGAEEDLHSLTEPDIRDKGTIPESLANGPQLPNGPCESAQGAVDGTEGKKTKTKKTKTKRAKEEVVAPEVEAEVPKPEVEVTKGPNLADGPTEVQPDADDMAKMKEHLLAMATSGSKAHQLLIEELTSSFEESSTDKTPANVIVESVSDDSGDTLKVLDDDMTIREIDDSLMGVEEIPLDDLSLEDILENVRALRRLQTITEVDEITDEDDSQHLVISALRPELQLDDTSATTSSMSLRRSHSWQPLEHSPVTRTMETIRRSSDGDTLEGGATGKRTKDSPIFVMKLQDITVPVGYRIRLTCCAIGTPDPKTRWLKNGSEIRSDMGYREINDFGISILEIPRASPADSADFTCVAQNANGEDNTSARLIVRGRLKPDLVEPAFTRTILDMRGHCGDSITMDCTVIGWPNPNVAWMKDGHPLELDDRMTTTVTSGGTHRLVIQDALCSDSGVYKCMAQNALGKDEITASVKIMDKTAYQASRFARGSLSKRNRPGAAGGPHHGDPPRFLSELEDRSAHLGSNVTFRCEVTGKPRPEITWLHNGHPLQPSSHVKFSQQDNSYTLTVLDSSYSDLGMYSCKATNQAGTAYTSGCLNFGLKDEEMEFGLAPVFITKPNSVNVERNEKIVLACKVEGKPRPKVTWLKGARDMSLSRRAYKDSKGDIHKLVIHRAMNVDDGEYIVEARNKLGKEVVRCSVNVQNAGSQGNGDEVWDYRKTTSALNELRGYRPYVQRKELPGPIGGEPKVTDTGRNWATLVWPRPVHDGGSSILAYRIEACELPGDDWEEVGLSPITICDLYNLKPESQYLFRVSARNMVGWGQPISMSSPLVITRRPDMPHFTSIPPSCVQAAIGSTITVECLVSGKPKPNISWYKNRERLRPFANDRYEMVNDGVSARLTIMDIQPEDEGCYMCEATSEGGRVTTFTVVAVADDTAPSPDQSFGSRPRTPRLDEAGEFPPVFTMRLRDRTVQLNGMVRLTCQIQGAPPPTVTWFQEGEEVKNSGHAHLIQEGNFYTLEIAKATEAHSGEYTIVASNNHGGVACKCRLVVDSDYNRLGQAPMFSKHLEDMPAMAPGQTATLHCKIVHPGGKTTWFHEGRKLMHSRKHRTKRMADGTCLLTVLQVSESDAGTYTCVVSNESGRSSSTCSLTVDPEAYYDGQKSRLEQERARTEPHGATLYSKVPIFLTKPRSTEVVEFDSVELLCEVIGDPKPEVLWLRDGLTFKYQKDPEHFIRLGDGPCYRLEIPSVTIDDTGTYTVIAHNCHGEAKAIISLQVFARGQGLEEGMSYKPQTKAGKVATRPEVVQTLKDLQCTDGDSVTFECRIEAVQQPEVRWEKDGHVIRPSEDFHLFHEGQICRLRISEVFPEDEGEYVCIAYNDAGKVNTSARLTVRRSDEKENDFSYHQLDSVDVHQRPLRKRIVPICGSRFKKKMTGPKFITHPHNRVVDEGDTVKFTCSIAGHPEPLVQWDKLGRLLKTSGRMEVLERDDLHSLVIHDVVPADAGIYTVTASNTVGKVYATAKLDVVAKRKGKPAVPAPSPAPSILPPPKPATSRVFTVTAYEVPRILRPLSDLSTRAGDPLFMSCEIMSQPEARISWMLNEMILKSSRSCRTRYNGRLATLQLDRLPNGLGTAGEAVVTCTATNPHGTVSTSAKLTIMESHFHPRKSQNATPETSSIKTSKWGPLVYKPPQPKSWQPQQQQHSSKCPSSPVKTSSPRMAQVDPGPTKRVPAAILKSRLKSAPPPVPPKPASRTFEGTKQTTNGCVTVQQQQRQQLKSSQRVSFGSNKPSEEGTTEESSFRKGAPPVFLQELKDVVTRDGENVTLTVHVSGHPPFEIIWVHNDQEISNCDATRCVAHDDHRYSLVIGDIFPEDSGMYTCEAYNMYGDADTSCRVHVTEPNCTSEPSTSRPRILTGLPEQTEAIDGNHLRLSVQISGKPTPIVEWLKDGHKLSAFIRIKTYSEGNRHICEFSRVRLRDVGIYSVMAVNNLGKATASTALSIQPRSTPSRQLSSEMDDVLLTTCCNGSVGIPNNGVVNFGSEEKPSEMQESGYQMEANLGNLESGSSNGLGEPFQVKWQSNSEKLPSTTTTTSSSSQLPQKSLGEKKDEVEGGQTDNNLQVGTNGSISNGFVAPTIVVKESPPQIIRGPQNITILRGQKACLKVHFIGKPQCNVKWIKGGRIVECCERIRMETCEEMSCLTLDNVHSDDSGKYIVVVENTHGADCHFASLAVEGPPDPPASKPVVSQVTSSSVTLCWYGSSYDGGSVITGYIVEMAQADTKQWQVLTTNCHSTSYVVTGLESGTRYVFRILAQNVHGVSCPSKVSEQVLIKEESSEDEEVFSERPASPLKKPPVNIEDGANFGDMYDTKEELGKGRFGRVHRVLQKHPKQQEYAAKFIRCIKSKDKEAVKEEIAIMNCLHHSKLLQLIAAFEKPREIIIILEYISGGELFERVVDEDFDLTEKDCILFTRQICEGVRYMHEQSVMHLDLKPENILCLHRENHQIKLIDFGLARKYDPERPIRVMFGTPEFVAPEIINYETISPASDMWSIGVICYVLLSGLSPFMGDNDAETFSNITRSVFDFEDESFDAISQDAKDFISALLVKKKEKRMLAQECLKHHWLAQHERTMSSVKLCKDKLKKFIVRRKWQCAAAEVEPTPYRKRMKIPFWQIRLPNPTSPSARTLTP